mmetsp:Transcript_26581/g.64204  ORF Transcript_26581/g.64204 Transcript_26581/m.64204 type:complete len:309 (-) Transcript_26581:26-952(-)
MRGSWREACQQWLQRCRRCIDLCGVWERPLFMGGFREHTDADTEVYNVQTPSLFVDLRFPRTRDVLVTQLPATATCVGDLTTEQLRLLARQHCFAGYSLPDWSSGSLVVSRHHIVDWNYSAQFPRSRPNQWRVQFNEDRSSFKEWSVAVDAFGQAVYMERWQRRPEGDPGRYLALYRAKGSPALLVLVGDRFAFAEDRSGSPIVDGARAGGCAALADVAAGSGDRGALEQLVGIAGSTGLVDARNGRPPWTIDRSTHPWLEGTQLCLSSARMDAESFEIDGQRWEVAECSMSRSEALALLQLARRSSL